MVRLRRRRVRRNPGRSSGTDWGNVILWTAGIGAGLFVAASIAGISIFSSAPASAPKPALNLQTAAQLFSQITGQQKSS